MSPFSDGFSLLKDILSQVLNSFRPRVRPHVLVHLRERARTLSSLGAYLEVSNLSEVGIFVHGIEFIAEELLDYGDPIVVDIGRIVPPYGQESFECHEEIYKAFQKTGHSGDVYVGSIRTRVLFQVHNRRACTRWSYYDLTSNAYGVQSLRPSDRSLSTRVKRWLAGLDKRIKRHRALSRRS